MRPKGAARADAFPGSSSGAYRHHHAGDVTAAERDYREVLALAPEQSQALQHVASFELERGRRDEALGLLRRAAESDPTDAVCRNNLGNLLQEADQLDEALEHYRAALREAPRYESACFNLARTLHKQGQFDTAAGWLRELTSWRPEDAEAWTALGLALQDAGRVDDALAAHRRALALEPSSADAHNNLGAVYMDLGEFSRAEASFQAAIENDPTHAPAFANLVTTRRFDRADEPVVQRMEALLGRAEDAQAIDLNFALGKVREDRREFAPAFSHYQAANALKRRSLHYDRAQARVRADALAAAFDAGTLERCRGYGDSSEVPVFIVGMPRSGTTLVEQIVASHPQAFGAGELPHLERLALSLPRRVGASEPYPRCASSLDERGAKALAREYLHELREAGGGATRVTDKMPSNYLHLGLVAIALPRARVIHCRRDPMDVCTSIYSRHFAHRLAYAYAYALEDIAAEYLAYERLMAHWRTILDLETLAIRYEDLVADPARATRALLEFCELPWDARCLRFYETARSVRTASNWQVRQPVYRDAVERWRRFEAFLAPLRKALEASGSGPLSPPLRGEGWGEGS